MMCNKCNNELVRSKKYQYRGMCLGAVCGAVLGVMSRGKGPAYASVIIMLTWGRLGKTIGKELDDEYIEYECSFCD